MPRPRPSLSPLSVSSSATAVSLGGCCRLNIRRAPVRRRGFGGHGCGGRSRRGAHDHVWGRCGRRAAAQDGRDLRLGLLRERRGRCGQLTTAPAQLPYVVGTHQSQSLSQVRSRARHRELPRGRGLWPEDPAWSCRGRARGLLAGAGRARTRRPGADDQAEGRPSACDHSGCSVAAPPTARGLLPGELVRAAEHGKGDLPGCGLALKPTLFDPQNVGSLGGRVQRRSAVVRGHAPASGS